MRGGAESDLVNILRLPEHQIRVIYGVLEYLELGENYKING